MKDEDLECKINEIESEIEVYKSILEWDEELEEEDINDINNDIRIMKEWIKELKGHKVGADNKDSRRRIEILENMTDNCEVNIKEGNVEGEGKELLEEELGYIKKWLKEIKK